MADKKYILGMDIGTTSVKVCVLDAVTREVVAKQNKDTAAAVPSEQGAAGSKQDVPRIVSAVHACVSRLPKELLRHVATVGVCGQMHGLLLWKSGDECAWESVEKDGAVVRYEAVRERMSALYTWQDTRCTPDFLATLPPPRSHLRCYSGYGCATMLWMARNKPGKLDAYNCAGTVQDFLVAMLCGLEAPVMSEQNAASWGYYDTERGEWNAEVLRSAGFPVRLLPRVVRAGALAGRLGHAWYGIAAGTPVGAALGDLQCSFLATLESERDAVLNVSTSAQLGFVVDAVGGRACECACDTVEYLPYFDGRHLAVAASLNGGNALATFVRTLQQWALELGHSVPQSKVWERLIALGGEAADGDGDDSPMEIRPLLLGERHEPSARATVANVNLSNLGLGQVFRALCDGLIRNLHGMMPRELLRAANVERIVGNGSGLSRNPVLQRAVEHYYSLPLEFTSGGDAARGAALALAPALAPAPAPAPAQPPA